MYIYIYIHMCINIHIYIYKYMLDPPLQDLCLLHILVRPWGGAQIQEYRPVSSQQTLNH